MSGDGLMRCYNKGCGKEFREEQNTQACQKHTLVGRYYKTGRGSPYWINYITRSIYSCIHHPGVPVFHDALKGWSCCRKRVTDFTEFLNIPGCTKDKHSNVKPTEPEKVQNTPMKVDEVINVQAKPAHRPKITEPKPRPSDDLPKQKLKTTVTDSLRNALAKLKETLMTKSQAAEENSQCDSDEVTPGTTCKNSGCTMVFVNEGSSMEKCWHHPGVPIFHEGYKFWTCCQRRTTDFNEFLKQEGCTGGSHRWKLTDEEKRKRVLCRYEWYQMGNSIVISVYAKNSDPENSTFEASQTMIAAHIAFGEGNEFDLDLSLQGLIEPEKSSVLMSPTKVEIKLRKAEIGSWSNLELRKQTDEKPSE